MEFGARVEYIAYESLSWGWQGLEWERSEDLVLSFLDNEGKEGNLTVK